MVWSRKEPSPENKSEDIAKKVIEQYGHVLSDNCISDQSQRIIRASLLRTTRKMSEAEGQLQTCQSTFPRDFSDDRDDDVKRLEGCSVGFFVDGIPHVIPRPTPRYQDGPLRL